MNFKNRRAPRWQMSLTALLIGLMFFGQTLAQTTAVAPAKLSTAEISLAERVSLDTIKEATAALAAPEMQGRGTMQPGGDKAAAWIADRFQKLGLKPLGDKGTYLQKIEFKEIVFAPETMLKVGGENLKLGTDFSVLTLPRIEKTNKNASSDMIFVAYGIQSKAINRADLEGVDLLGKIVVMLDGPPANISQAEWEGANARAGILRFLVNKGVAGIISIPHGREKEPIEKLIDDTSRRDISIGDENPEPTSLPALVAVSGKAAEKLFAKSGVSMKDALARAEQEGFKPFKLNQEAKIVAKYKSTKGAGNNVVGYIEGSDPTLKAEAVLFSAHYDAYGMENGKIYPGAADNALGVAEMLAVAEAYSKMETKPKRSMIFLAVTGEEYGLFGSKHWAKKPTWDIKKVAANLNLDGIGTEVYAPVKTFVGFGAEHSTLGALLNDVSGSLGIKVIPDPAPEENIFYRSDHYSFVERGVPALMLLGAPEGDPKKWLERSREWEKTDYHAVGDVIKNDWDWGGAKTVAVVMGILGLRISDSPTMPSWLPTSRFAKMERGNSKDVPK
jgi:hypothetical protein